MEDAIRDSIMNERNSLESPPFAGAGGGPTGMSRMLSPIQEERETIGDTIGSYTASTYTPFVRGTRGSAANTKTPARGASASKPKTRNTRKPNDGSEERK